MKKILLGLGALTTVIVPVIGVISCGSDSDSDKNNKNKVNKKDLSINSNLSLVELKSLSVTGNTELSLGIKFPMESKGEKIVFGVLNNSGTIISINYSLTHFLGNDKFVTTSGKITIIPTITKNNENVLMIPSGTTDLRGIGSLLKSLPNDFEIPATVIKLGGFGSSLIFLPEGFSIPDGVTDLGSFGRTLTSIPEGFTIPDSVIHLGSFGRHLTSIPSGFTIPSHIEDLKFFGAELTSVPNGFVIPESVEKLNQFGSSFTSIPSGFTIPSTVRELGAFGFSLTSLPQGFIIPDSVSELESFGHSFISIPDGFTIPNTISSLEHFGDSLKSIPNGFTIPSHVTDFGDFGESLAFPFTKPTVQSFDQEWDDNLHAWNNVGGPRVINLRSAQNVIVTSLITKTGSNFMSSGHDASELTTEKILQALSLDGYTFSLLEGSNVAPGGTRTYRIRATENCLDSCDANIFEVSVTVRANSVNMNSGQHQTSNTGTASVKSAEDVVVTSLITKAGSAFISFGHDSSELTTEKILQALSLDGYTFSLMEGSNVGPGMRALYKIRVTETNPTSGDANIFEMNVTVIANQTHMNSGQHQNSNTGMASVKSAKDVVVTSLITKTDSNFISVGHDASELTAQNILGALSLSGYTFTLIQASQVQPGETGVYRFRATENHPRLGRANRFEVRVQVTANSVNMNPGRHQNSNTGMASVKSAKDVVVTSLITKTDSNFISFGHDAFELTTEKILQALSLDGYTFALIEGNNVGPGITKIYKFRATETHPVSGRANSFEFDVAVQANSASVNPGQHQNSNTGMALVKSAEDVVVTSLITKTGSTFMSSGHDASELTTDKILQALSLDGYTFSLINGSNIGSGGMATYKFRATENNPRSGSANSFEVDVQVTANSASVSEVILNGPDARNAQSNKHFHEIFRGGHKGSYHRQLPQNGQKFSLMIGDRKISFIWQQVDTASSVAQGFLRKTLNQPDMLKYIIQKFVHAYPDVRRSTISRQFNILRIIGNRQHHFSS